MEDARNGNGIVCCCDDDDDVVEVVLEDLLLLLEGEVLVLVVETSREGDVARNDVSPNTSYINNVVGLESMHNIFLLLVVVDCCCGLLSLILSVQNDDQHIIGLVYPDDHS